MDENAARRLLGPILSDTGGAFTVALAYLGDRLGLFRAMAGRGPMTSDDLARRAGLHERYVREWLKGMVASGYLDMRDGRSVMTDEQAAVLADESSPFFACGAFQLAVPTLLQIPKVMEAFKKGGGVPFSAFGDEIAEGIDRLHRPAFEHLLAKWVAAVPGLVPRLEAGASVLDVGCGIGRSSVVLAKAHPRARMVGVDPHPPSIRRARELARGLANVEFVEATLEKLPPARYEVVLAFDCIHDLPDPVRALRLILERLTPTGLFLWVEPSGSDNPMENRNPIGRMRAAISPLHCLTVAMAEGGSGLGTIIGEAGARDLSRKAGFTDFAKLPIDNSMQQFFLLRP